MAYENWDDVIIQWVNCLDIAIPIQDVDECKNGQFFQKFLSILSPEKNQPYTLEIIHHILGEVYKDFKFDTTKTNFFELSREETIEICLLLLYYACVIKKNATLISPLCARLPQKFQICIKQFLENMTDKIDAEILHTIAIESLNSTMASNCWTSDIPPLKTDSPLRSYLTIPDGNIRKLIDKEVKVLRIELESERFEKEGLQEELKTYKDKIMMLEGKLKKSCEQMNKLRLELSNKDDVGETILINGGDIEKRYKSEVESLEKYVAQLEKEQIELKERNEKLIESLKVSDEELKICQEKMLGLETENKDLREKYKQQEEVVENLKADCIELKVCLDELRPASNNFETSVILTPQSKMKRRSLNYSVMENLAGSVVEVQLEDFRKENAQLQDLLLEMKEESKLLEEQIVAVKNNYEKALQDCSELKNKNEESTQKIEELIKSNQNMDELLKRSMKEIEDFEQLISNKDSIILDMERSLEKTNDLKKELKDNELDLTEKLRKVSCEFTDYKIEAENISKNLNSAASQIQAKFEKSVSNYNNLNTSFISLQKSYNVTMNKFSKNLKKLSEIANDQIDGSLEDKFEFFDALVSSIDEEKVRNKNLIKNLTESLHEGEEVINNLKATQLILNEKLVLTKTERDQFEKMLKNSEIHVNELENTLKLKMEDSNKITAKISELHTTINELEFIKSLRSNLNQSNSGEILDDFIMNVKETSKEIESLKNEINQVNEFNENLSRELVEKERMFLEKIFLLESEIKDYKIRIQELETIIDTSKEDLKIKQIEIAEIENGKITMEENYEKIKFDLLKKIDLTRDTQKKLELEIQIISKEKSNLENNLGKFENDLNKLQLEKEDLIEQNDELKGKYSECFETLSRRELELDERDNIISESNTELLTIKLELERCKQKHNELQINMDKIRQEESKYKFCITTLEEQNHAFETKLHQLLQEKEALKNLKDSLEKKSQDLERNLEIIITQLKEKNENLNEYCNQLSLSKQESEKKIMNIKRDLEEAQYKLERVLNEKNDAIKKKDDEIKSLKMNLIGNDNRIYELTSKEVNYLQEIEILKSELNNSFQKYADNFNAFQELKLIHEAEQQNLTETLRDLGVECNRLKEENKIRSEQLSQIINERDVLKSEKIGLEVKLVAQHNKYEEELENTREQFLLDINNLINKEKKLELALSKALNDLESGRGIQYRLENEVKKVSSKISDVQQEKASLGEKLSMLEVTKKDIDLEYSQLKLVHEKLINESENCLRDSEKKLEGEIENLKKENQEMVNEYFELQKSVEQIKENHKNVEMKHEKIINDLNDEIKSLCDKISNLEILNEKITKEQDNLLKNTRKLKLEIDEYVEKEAQQNDVISKLQCAFDILQTGKDRVELDLQNAIETKNKLEDEKIKLNDLIEEKSKSFESELNKINDDIKKKTEIINDKDYKLGEKIKELNNLQQIYETVSSEKESLQQRLQESQNLHKQFLTEIDEENLRTLENMTLDFFDLKGAYQNVNLTLKQLKKEKKKLEKSLDEVNTSKKELEIQYKEKQKIFEQINNKSLNYQEIIVKERNHIHEVLYELHRSISDLEFVKNEKLETDKQSELIKSEINELKSNRDDLIKIKTEFYNNKEIEIEDIHLKAETIKSEMLKSINNVRFDYVSTSLEKERLKEIIEKEKESKTILEVKLLNLMSEKIRFEEIINKFYTNINKIAIILVNKPILNSPSFENISQDEMKFISGEIEKGIGDVFSKIYEINETVTKLEGEKCCITNKIDLLRNEKDLCEKEKIKLLGDYEALNKERNDLEKSIDEKMINLKSENDVLHQTIQSLRENNVRAYNDYQKFIELSKNNKNQIDQLLKNRNSTETILNDLKQKLLTLQMKFVEFVHSESFYKQYFDQKESLQIIADDIQRQFNRYSRISFNIVINFGTLSEKIVNALFSEKSIEIEAILKDLDIEETLFKIDGLKDRAVDAIEQIVALEKVFDNIHVKTVLKENKNNQLETKTDDEYRKKYLSVKQKLTLVENVKNNYEKKLKQLREENKKLSLNKTTSDDTHYKTLIQQHIDTKESYEKQINELKSKQIHLENELLHIQGENLQNQTFREKHSQLEKEIVDLQTEKLLQHKTNKQELDSLRDAYSKLMKDKNKLESDLESLKKSYDDRLYQINEDSLIKEAYQKILEENNQINTELDTLKFKRNKDKEEFVRLLQKQREDFVAQQDTTIADIRNQYEVKLEAIKKKMLSMFKEEVDKETRKVLAKEADNAVLLTTLEKYKTDYEDAKKTNDELRKRIGETTRQNELMLSRESIGARSVRSECDVRELRTREVIDCPRNGKRSSVHPVRTVVEARKCMTLPKNIDQNRVVSPANIDKFEMEDEAECFHNKYLADLKNGRCVLPSEESPSTRMSELAWRNSQVPPHLKSSYPAELQMINPSRFKEEDIKAGNIDLDDSMNTKLLPADKALRKKEQGTTSYKKPGPPTPSKNGGRISLQGGELPKDGALQDYNDLKTPKRTTPNKFKAFFLGRTSLGGRSSTSANPNIENQPPSPKNRQINKLFRKPR
ncbi:putative leucine-rich repeat-containing protein DDB_G0290503 [Onthophagus taurus]|uniref:putative leucine-rich repeat-containing protein DDB_G0290503 n=1 Tax=Onthophagus taurus TaxID=166361 RepID=UPI0039BE3C60